MLIECIVAITVSLPGSRPLTVLAPDCEKVEKSIRAEMRRSHGLEGLIAYETDLIKNRYRRKP